MNPFLIKGPATISFSGGRTSGYMLRRILNEGLQPDVHVLFSNTGKERNETLDFIHEIETHWNVKIFWLEYENKYDGKRYAHSYREVNYETANRFGGPFAKLIGARKYLPNPVTRFCTQELKIRPMQKWARAHHFEHWNNVVGLRADEPRRVANMRAKNSLGKERYDVVMPLADANVTKPEVLAFWKTQPFDLQLQDHEGNCDLCFLKGRAKKEQIIADRPSSADWWIEQESRFLDKSGRPATFRINAPSYATMRETARHLPVLCESPDDLGDCACTD